ncbi:MAG: flagellin [Methylothermaceae bacteria B42]|nr:MAG: flagellin [Methylothermaceae bacteria B42]HHJ39573.1 flagellin [Methylothermaceae bacterium]
MPQVINTNIASINTQRQLNRSQDAMQTAMERLSSGLRINSAKDDAAGLAISDRMTAQIRGLNQAVRNANDGISLAQTAEGALQESTNILQRMRELSIQSANDTNTAADRANLQKEINQLVQELDRIATHTTFNGKKLLDGTFNGQEFQIGAFADQSISVTVGNARTQTMGVNKMTNDDAAGTINSAVGATTNNVGAQDITVDGFLGNEVVSVVAGETAKSIADGINGVSESTGVTARAVTYAKLSGASAPGQLSFDLYGKNETTPVKVSAQISSTTDLTELAKAINDHTGETGVSAVLAEDKSSLVLKNEEGFDITIDVYASSTTTLDMEGLKEDGDAKNPVPNAVTLSAGGSATVGGNVIVESHKAFTLESSAGTTFLSAATTPLGSSLENVSNINIGTQRGATDAISVIDGALAFIADARGDLGAIQNRFSSTIANLENVSQNVAASRSRIQDADFAKESAELARTQILQQAGTAMLAQANASNQNVLSLLQG